MQTHDDDQHIQREFMDRLRGRADKMVADKASQITTGKDGEEELATWKSHGVFCRHMPDDEQGILRISVGGGNGMPVELNYCTIRGSVGNCIDLLKQTIKALEDAP